MLTKQSLVLDFVWLVDDKATFSYDDGGNMVFWAVDGQAWADMGQPRKITVTIEPGDRLNGS